MQAEIDLLDHELFDWSGSVIGLLSEGMGAEIELGDKGLYVARLFCADYRKPGKPRRRYFEATDNPLIAGLIWSVKQWGRSKEGQKALEAAWEDAREEARISAPDTQADYRIAGMRGW